jgi:hypothetical protein
VIQVHKSVVNRNVYAVKSDKVSADLGDMKLLAVVISDALTASATTRNPRSAPRSERRDAAAAQRRIKCASCERDSRGAHSAQFGS